MLGKLMPGSRAGREGQLEEVHGFRLEFSSQDVKEHISSQEGANTETSATILMHIPYRKGRWSYKSFNKRSVSSSHQTQ